MVFSCTENMSSFSFDYVSTKHFNTITYYFKAEFVIENCTIYRDISSVSEKDFRSFKQEYDSYKEIIFRTVKKLLIEKYGEKCILEDIKFEELKFNELNQAIFSTLLTITLNNEVARDIKTNISFFGNLLGTIFRMRDSRNPSAGFFFKYGSLIGHQTSQDKEYNLKRLHKTQNSKGEILIIEDDSVSADTTLVVNVKVKYLRSGDASMSHKKYNNLKEWMEDPNNVYIARRGIVFINGERFPKKDSIWANPFKISAESPVDDCCEKYRDYISEKLEKDENLVKELLNLKGKNLGCWCKEKDVHPQNRCHGDIILELIKKYDS